VKPELVGQSPAMTVKAALPGYGARDIEIHVGRSASLTADNKKRSRRRRKEEPFILNSVQTPVFPGIDLPMQIEPEKVRSTISNCELQIELPKIKQARRLPSSKAAA